MKTPPLPTRLAAEVVGTFGFFFLGFSGISAFVDQPGSIGSGGIAAGFGLGLAAMIFAYGHISGGHYNPAVTAGLAAGRQFPLKEVVPYWVAQLVGGFGAAVLANLVYSSAVQDKLLTLPGAGISNLEAVVLEIVATFLFVTVIITVATDVRAPWKGILAPVAIGGYLFTAATVIGPSSGGSFNPARSIDPAIYAGEFSKLWIYIVGPLAGGIIAGFVFTYFRNAGE